jgi:hypothetical protein
MFAINATGDRVQCDPGRMNATRRRLQGVPGRVDREA